MIGRGSGDNFRFDKKKLRNYSHKMILINYFSSARSSLLNLVVAEWEKGNLQSQSHSTRVGVVEMEEKKKAHNQEISTPLCSFIEK